MRSRGIVLGEVLVGLAIAGVLLALLLVAGDRQRRATGLSQSEANLRQFGTSHASYGNDSAGRVATFSWRNTDTGMSQFSDLKGPFASNYASAASQAVDIMRRRSGSTAGTMPPIGFWIPHILFSHLVLVDYLGQRTPAPWMVSPGDAPRLGWRKTGIPPSPSDVRSYVWVQSTSYELPAAFYGTDFGTTDGTSPTFIQASEGYLYWQEVGDVASVVGKRRYDEVTFPGGKVLMFETMQRFFGPRDAFFAYPEARVPALMCDGSVATRPTWSSNPSGIPTRPDRLDLIARITYNPASNPPLGDPAALYNQPAGDSLDGSFRWTRYGMRGRDFDGPIVTSLP